jgi:hypothetical protein
LSIKSIEKNFNGDSNREGGGETGRMRYKDRYGQRERYQEGSLGIDHII